MIMRKHQTGFTIVELMIATTVFSVVLILISIGLLNIGRMFYKSVNIVNTQEVARTITEDVSQAIQFSGDTIATSIATAGDGTQGFCVGSRRYSYLMNAQLTDGAVGTEQSRHVMVVDTLPSGTCNTTTTAQAIKAGALTAGSRELMGSGMRIAGLDFPPPNPSVPGLYNFRIRVVFGNFDVLTPDRQQCLNQRTESQFCAASELTTSVQRRIQ